jgi:hypothetical protein
VRRLVTRVDKRKRGKFRVRGRYSIGGAVGTAWLTEDRCDGTFTRVDSGAVRVDDLVRHRHGARGTQLPCARTVTVDLDRGTVDFGLDDRI